MKPQLKVVRGGAAPSESEDRTSLERDLHTIWTRMADRKGNVPAPAFYELRRRRQHPARVLVRRLDEAISACANLDDIVAVPRRLEVYIRRSYHRRWPQPKRAA